MELPKLCEIREDKKYSQLYMAKKMGISQPHYCRLEKKGHLTAEQLLRISEILETPVNELMVGHKSCDGK